MILIFINCKIILKQNKILRIIKINYNYVIYIHIFFYSIINIVNDIKIKIYKKECDSLKKKKKPTNELEIFCHFLLQSRK